MELPEQIRMNITADNLPSNFENEIIKNNEIVSIRCNLKSMDDINKWVKEFGNSTNTKWNCRNSCPSGKKFVCWKKFECQHSSSNKVPLTKNKKGISKNAECLASIRVKIKLNTTRMRKEDAFLRRGLDGLVTIIPFHKHSLMTAETLRFLPAVDCREQFEAYFSDGMGPAEAAKYHKEIVEMKSDFHPSDLANGRINPGRRTIEYWYEKWRLLHLGSRNGPGMIEKLKEKFDIPTINRNIKSPDESPSSTSKSLHSIESNSSDYNDPPYNDENSQNEELRGELIKLFTDGFEKFGSSKQVLEKAVGRLRKITSAGQWETMLATLGSNVPLSRKAGVPIRVQPTSIARRAVRVTKGSKRVACGRPSKGLVKKRKHNLVENVKLK